jgi:hypothetical protein
MEKNLTIILIIVIAIILKNICDPKTLLFKSEKYE